MALIVIRGGNVLDVARGEWLPHHHVVIERERIVEVSERAPALADAHVIDALGKTVMPGLIDCHVHVLASHANLGSNAAQPNLLAAMRALPILRAMLLRGFTSVRDAGGADGGLAQAIALGLVTGPRLFPSGKALSQTGGHGDFRMTGDSADPCDCHARAGAIARVADGVDAVRLAVRQQIRDGATQIKVMASGGVASPVDEIGHSQYSEAEIRAAVDEARAANTYVMAHAYTGAAITRAIRCGVRTIEHGNLVDAAAAALMREHGAYAVPTLVTYEAIARCGASGMPAAALDKLAAVREAGRASLEIFANAGVPMGFGTDLLGDMHHLQGEEFRLRAERLGNLEALRAATTVAARILGRPDTLGTIAPGAMADVLVVDGDPLADIGVLAGNGERIDYVLHGGRVQRRGELVGVD
ncbi:metal-dependent hydrolase family protein [Burkholderia oklahomensis]|uniref:Amidohydrolase family protein n=1 Tax=Burkholderia oklahomensis TaxID=342113 RepID=A0AAI8B904_9BURK|nr:amidohydrolase family protein [Burkholderia oklahomensis]AIO67674.1 amidohydrolase family protein [Burkholderia oklahomensis]AJX31866.1 amidohydrolase family protein [Burkholderia oklahomensis C6786]AOI42808.1 peptidase M38 [Burkholderia oklahomensis EO147]AOI46297.1 peptidase M38 [Burkholderia oklahomensis C6786]KUY53945.1 peptidase M38 [Burkholderia oklahomensis C6786]